MATATGISASQPSSTTMMDTLKPNLMTKVLEFGNLQDRLSFASVSKHARRVVMKECKELWIHLDFSILSPSVRSNLTDKHLAGLLKRVNAKHVTQSLILASCNNIDGSGLTPVRRSKVLSVVDLRRGYDSESRAVKELRTMIPYKLSHVRFNHSIASYGANDAVTIFMRDLAAAKQKQALQDQTKCNACGTLVVDESRQLVANVTGLPPFQCNECHKSYCLGGTTCPIKMEICASCGGAKCATCDKETTKTCDSCSMSYCKDCASFTECLGCKGVSCNDCNSFCSFCDSAFCTYCCQVEGAIFPCFACNEEFCFSCRQVCMCQDCETFLCSECVQVKHCMYCGGDYCVKCRDVTSMGNECLEVIDEDKPVFADKTIDVCVKCQAKMDELL